MKILILFFLIFNLNWAQGQSFQKAGQKVIDVKKFLRIPPENLHDPLYGIKFEDKRVLSNTGGKYKTIPMIEQYRDFDRKKWTKYFTPTEMAEREVIINKGIFIRKGTNIPLDSNTDSQDYPTPFVFVMDKNGRLFVERPGIDEHVKNFHHSSFLSGNPAAMAGTIQFNDDGQIVALTSQSGHYRPKKGMIDQTIDLFLANGVNYIFWVRDFWGPDFYKPEVPVNENGWWGCCKNRVPLKK